MGINGVAMLHTDLEPDALFICLKTIEHEMGRRTGEVRFGPRILDLDILFYDELVLREEMLEIPHPRLHERRFVLKPLCDIAPDLVHPVIGQTVQHLLHDLKDGGKKVTLYKCDY